MSGWSCLGDSESGTGAGVGYAQRGAGEVTGALGEWEREPLGRQLWLSSEWVWEMRKLAPEEPGGGG